jgi:hypothetical protein
VTPSSSRLRSSHLAAEINLKEGDLRRLSELERSMRSLRDFSLEESYARNVYNHRLGRMRRFWELIRAALAQRQAARNRTRITTVTPHRSAERAVRSGMRGERPDRPGGRRSLPALPAAGPVVAAGCSRRLPDGAAAGRRPHPSGEAHGARGHPAGGRQGRSRAAVGALGRTR